MERIVRFEAGYDKRNPDPAKNYGIHGVQIRFVLKGAKGATQFLLSTDWYPQHVQMERVDGAVRLDMIQPMAMDIGYHSPAPQYEGQTSMGACECLDGRECYYDGSGLRAEPIRDRMLVEGDAAVWEELEAEYVARFGALE